MDDIDGDEPWYDVGGGRKDADGPVNDKGEESEEPSTLYDLLFCAPDASDHDLRQAYKQQALHWHPDKNSEPEAEERFKRINHAWSILSNEQQRAAYDQSLRDGTSGGGGDGAYFDAAAAAAASAREAYAAFMAAEEHARKVELRRERGFLVGTVSFALWAALLLVLMYMFCADRVPMLFPRAHELSSATLAKYPLDLDFNSLRARLEKVAEGHSSSSGSSGIAGVAALTLPRWLGGAELARTTTPYLRIALNGGGARVRRAPEVGRPRGRGWTLVTQQRGEDIYGREIDLVAHTFLFTPGEVPSPWPPTEAVCARLIRSGSIKHKEWFPDLSRSVGGRLRPFALAIVASGECGPDLGLPALALSTIGALLLARATARLALGPAR